MKYEFKDLTDEVMHLFVKEYQLQHNKFTERQLADVIRQILLSGDLERHINVLHQQAIVYIPYARQHVLECERDDLRKQVQDLEKRMENIARETGYLEQLEAAERRASDAAAEAGCAKMDAYYK